VSVPAGARPGAGTASGDLTPQLLDSEWWTDDMVADAGIPVTDVPFVTVGGGIGSFAVVDLLRVAGVGTDQIRVLTGADHPWQQYEYLARCSQLPGGERLRSDSSSIPDNIWGFPGLALREAWRTRRPGPVVRVLAEPVLSDVWTPTQGAVLDGLARECARIGWDAMVLPGQVRMVRRRHGGGYYVILTPRDGAALTRRVAVRARYVHLAVGYPGVRFLDDLQAYRTRYGDVVRVVNAYEPHEHVYDELLARPGVVVVRGDGIVASRVLARLVDDRDRSGVATTILQIFDTYVAGSHGPSPFWRRRGGHGWAHQAFDLPKAALGGQLGARSRRLAGEERAAFHARIGGASTPRRRRWRAQLARGRAEGWYRVFAGTVEEVTPGEDGVVTRLRDAATGTSHDVSASFVIDCAGLAADLREHRVLADLLDHSGAGRNPLGLLDVDDTFAVRGADGEPGRVYASGSMTHGGPVPGVDTFLGLQIAALGIVDDLARQGFCRRIGVARSVAQWWRRMRWRAP